MFRQVILTASIVYLACTHLVAQDSVAGDWTAMRRLTRILFSQRIAV